VHSPACYSINFNARRKLLGEKHDSAFILKKMSFYRADIDHLWPPSFTQRKKIFTLWSPLESLGAQTYTYDTVYINCRRRPQMIDIGPVKWHLFQNERRIVLYSQKFPSGIEVYRVWSNYIIWRSIPEHGIWWLFHLPPSEILNWFWTRYLKTKIWMLTWKTYLLCIFQHRFNW
jgi:hypothetical protein